MNLVSQGGSRCLLWQASRGLFAVVPGGWQLRGCSWLGCWRSQHKYFTVYFHLMTICAGESCGPQRSPAHVPAIRGCNILPVEQSCVGEGRDVFQRTLSLPYKIHLLLLSKVWGQGFINAGDGLGPNRQIQQAPSPPRNPGQRLSFAAPIGIAPFVSTSPCANGPDASVLDPNPPPSRGLAPNVALQNRKLSSDGEQNQTRPHFWPVSVSQRLDEG